MNVNQGDSQSSLDGTIGLVAGKNSPEFPKTMADYLRFLQVIWKSWRLIAAVTAAFAFGAVIVSLLLPEYYRSAATMLPEGDKSKISSFGSLTDIASFAGFPVGDASLTKLYPAMLRSESVLNEVIYRKYQTQKFDQPVNLIEFWGISADSPAAIYEATLIKLRDELEVNVETRTNVITLSLATREPALSADIINAVMSELDKYIRTKRVTNASAQRKWIEQRLTEVKADLDSSEYKLRNFRESNRRILDSPNLLLAQARLEREIQINSTLYVELKKQYELIKIEEIKNLPVVNVLDSARPATERERPRRKRIVIATMLAGFVLGVGYVVVKWKYGDIVKDVLLTFKNIGKT